MRSNITAAVFPNGLRKTTTSPLWQYDYGQLLTFPDLELPTAFECHFSNEEHGTAVTQIGADSTVTIPDAMFISGAPIYAWIFLHAGEDDGETEYMVVIPIIKKARPSDAPPTPVEQTVVTQAIAALNAAADRAEQAAAKSGYLWFYIEAGKLYMDRTPNTQVDFYMQNGKLYVEERA